MCWHHSKEKTTGMTFLVMYALRGAVKKAD
jgi:hypothetical protein